MYPKLIENVIEHLSKLPGVGRRSAERMAFWILNATPQDAANMAQSIIQLKENLMFCRQCNHLSDTELCSVCSDSVREQSLVCVVEDPKDVIAIEKSGSYKGLYHVLLGTISPAEGRGPDDIKVRHLLNRIQEGVIKEVIIATDPDNEGEMTALFLSKQLKSFPIKVTRIGLGLPVGGAVEYADMSSLSASITARREIQS
jgi:recombination protein RecR